MVFSTPLFLFYFLPVFLVLYYLSNHKIQNILLLIFSIFFYTWGAPKFILIVLGSLLIDFYIIKKMNTLEGKSRRWLLISSIILNTGFLLYFKYANFFIENVNDTLGWLGLKTIEWTKVMLPIGISFFTFQKMSYSIDVYRKNGNPLHSVFDYALYILMFPQLIAGPIVRYKEVEAQLYDRSQNNGFDNRLVGFVRFAIGLSKKVLIANVLAEQADAIFAVSPDYFSSGTAWMGLFAYTFQIYFDFSGYSDMALGMGKMIGYEFPENFNFPYISQSISEFWRRWHITLGNWMKDYLYIPLGGNRIKISRIYLNLFIVFTISGFWHGAAWTFVAWGVYHGIFLIADRIFLLKVFNKLGKIPSTFITFFLAIMGWVLFRSESLSYAFQFYRKLFTFDHRIDEFYFDTRFSTILIIAALFSFMGIFKKMENLQYKLYSKTIAIKPLIISVFCSIMLYILCGGSLMAGGFNPFIYFRF
jgi:alginate O-acetyltransferase complex protein AlgI